MSAPRKYGVWGGNPNGTPEDATRCVQPVYDWHVSHQCARKRGHGPNGLYCKQHAKKAKP